MAKRADKRRREIERFRASNEPVEGAALESPTTPSVPGETSGQPRADGVRVDGVKTRTKRPKRTRKTAKHPKSLSGSLIELGVIVTVALGLALGIQRWIVKPYRIPSGSMEPTLKVGQRVLAGRFYLGGGPHVGQITVFHPPAGAEQAICGPVAHRVDPGSGAPCGEPVEKIDSSVNFIKRIVAGPGDEIYISAGHAYRRAAGTTKFVAEKDSYTAPCSPGSQPECNFPTPIKIPPGHWFMMGDNRGHSDDSRFWGPVPRSWIIGEAVFTYWPLDRIGPL